MGVVGLPRADSLDYARGVANAWERFIASYPVDDGRVRGFVLESWRRSQAEGVNPGRRSADVPNVGVTRDARHRRMVAAVEACLPPIVPYLAETRSVLIASDASGILLAVEGDRRLADLLALNKAVPGAVWHEHDVGTNAIGTALAIRKAVQIHGEEHFCEAGKRWSCTAAPIHDPGDESILGVIDVTGPASAALLQAEAFVAAMASRIQAFLAESELLDRIRLMELYCAQHALTAETVLFDRHGRIVSAPPGTRIEGVTLEPRTGLPGLNAQSIAEWRLVGLPDYIKVDSLMPLRREDDCLGGVLHLPQRPAPKPPRAPLAAAFQRLADTSPSLTPLLAMAQRYAARRIPLLLQGETGTGKDRLAAAIHQAGPVADGPYVPVNCAAFPRELIGSELFGHGEGAFTGARRGGAKGKFEQAHGGTIFLDEIGDMPLDLQPYLLRVLEDRVVTRLGEPNRRPVEVRVIAASNRPLERDVASGRFRADLFYRLNGAVLVLPPLRQRLDDLPMLTDCLLREIVPAGTVPPTPDAAVFAALRAYHWPGNVRELRNVLERMIADSADGTLDLAASGLGASGPWNGSTDPSAGPIRHTEKMMILKAIAASGGSIPRAARALGISRATIYRRLNAYRSTDA